MRMRDKTADFRVGQNRRFVIIQIASFFSPGKDKSCSRLKRRGLIINNYQYTNKMVLSETTQGQKLRGHEQQFMKIDNSKIAKLKFLPLNEIPVKLKYY